MLLYLACLWHWSIASTGGGNDIRHSEFVVARLSSCLQDTFFDIVSAHEVGQLYLAFAHVLYSLLRAGGSEVFACSHG